MYVIFEIGGKNNQTEKQPQCCASIGNKSPNWNHHTVDGWNPVAVDILTQPMAKRLKLFGDDEYLVGKISRSNGIFFRVQDG